MTHPMTRPMTHPMATDWLEVWLVGFYTIGSIAKENFVLPPLRAAL